MTDITTESMLTTREAESIWNRFTRTVQDISGLWNDAGEDLAEFERREGFKVIGPGYKTMAAFLKEQRGIEDRQVRYIRAGTGACRRLAEACPKVDLSERPMSQAAAAALSGVPDESIAKVYETAVEKAEAKGRFDDDDKKSDRLGIVTAKDVSEAKAAVLPGTKPKQRTESRPGSGSVAPAADPDQTADPEPEEDAADFALENDFGEPDEVEEAGSWDTPFKHLNAPHRLLHKAKQAIGEAEVALAEVVRLKAYRGSAEVRAVIKDLEACQKSVKHLEPFRICETCKGESCEACGMRGWLMYGDVVGFREDQT